MPEFTLRQRVTGDVMRFLLLLLLLTSLAVKADIYSYNNTDGDYIVTQKKPTDPDLIREREPVVIIEEEPN